MSLLKAKLGDILSKSGQNLPFLRDRENPAYCFTLSNVYERRFQSKNSVNFCFSIFIHVIFKINNENCFYFFPNIKV